MRCGAEKTAEVAEFGVFPDKALADEDWVNLAVTARQLGEHHATVEAAADKGAN
jgi:hypothetical protein